MSASRRFDLPQDQEADAAPFAGFVRAIIRMPFRVHHRYDAANFSRTSGIAAINAVSGGTILDPQDRHQFLNFSGVVLGGLALIAIGLGWAVEIDPLSKLSWSWRAFGWGLAGTLPLFVLFAAVYRLPIGEFRTIRKFLSTELAPSLAVLTWFDLVFLAVLTGIAEELFFRGLLESWMASDRFPWVGRVAASFLFGLAHLVTLTYGLMTFVVGLYLSWLMTWVDPPNLLIPIVTHAVYDYGGFLIIIWLHRRDVPAVEKSR